MFHKIIFKLGQHIRNPSIENWYAFLKKSEGWELEKLKAYQLEKLQELLVFAYENSSYYKERFDEYKVHPESLKRIEDLTKFPALNKEDVIHHNKSIHTNASFKKVFKATTSGSS